MFVLTAVPGVAFLLSAFAILDRTAGAEFATAALAEIRSTVAHNMGTFRDLATRDVRPILALGVFIAVLQQWCGVNVVFNYAHEVFASAVYQVSDILLNIVIIGVVNVVSTVIALVLVGLAVACFACTLSPVNWVILSEIFPESYRGAAGTFWLYSAVCLTGFAVVRQKLPETRALLWKLSSAG